MINHRDPYGRPWYVYYELSVPLRRRVIKIHNLQKYAEIGVIFLLVFVIWHFLTKYW